MDVYKNSLSYDNILVVESTKKTSNNLINDLKSDKYLHLDFVSSFLLAIIKLLDISRIRVLDLGGTWKLLFFY